MNEPFKEGWKFIPRFNKTLVVWSGNIEAIEGDTLFIKVSDDSYPNNFSFEMMEFPISKVPEDEKQYIKLGRTLYLAIGEHNGEADYHFEFTKYPPFTPEQIEAAKQRAEDLHNIIKWD